MPIIRIQRPAGATVEDYWAVQEKTGAAADPPAGLILHTAGEVDGGLQIVDVWESEEAAERFGNDRLLPAIREVVGDRGGPPPPPIVYELHNVVKP